MQAYDLLHTVADRASVFSELCEGKKRVNVYNLRELSGRSHQFSLNLMTLPAFLTIDASCLASAALAVDTATAVQTAFTVDTAGTASAFMTAV